jgi:broad specificity phosphatase PhoE
VAQTTILLVRHGETDWNAERRVQGHTDRPLNDTGLAQARALAEELAEEALDAVYASDLARAYETARVVAERHALRVEALPELRERDFGTWEGLTDDEVFERYPEARNGPWGDAETRAELVVRIVDAMRRIAVEHPGGRVLVVTHGGPLRAMLVHCAVDLDGPIANCHVARLAFQDGEFATLD